MRQNLVRINAKWPPAGRAPVEWNSDCRFDAWKLAALPAAVGALKPSSWNFPEYESAKLASSVSTALAGSREAAGGQNPLHILTFKTTTGLAEGGRQID